MKRLTVPMICVLTATVLLVLSGPAAAADLTIYANAPAEIRTGPMLQGSTWTFTYLLAGDQALIGAGMPATVYIVEHRTQRVADQFSTTLLPGSGILSVSPQWTCRLRVGWYDWTLWPAWSDATRTFLAMSQSFRVVKRL